MQDTRIQALSVLPQSMRDNPMWFQMLTLNNEKRSWEMPLINESGPVFPAISGDTMEKLLQITAGERVLDIGGGDSSFCRADVCTDAFPDLDVHRSGRKIERNAPGGKEFVQCFAEDLPFPDKSFDVAYSRAVFEHTIDPGAACREMMRVARRGYIETPTPLAEYVGGHPTHRWIVWVERFPGEEQTLVFRRKPFRRAPMGYLLRGLWFADDDLQWRWEWKYRNLIATQFAWEGQFNYRVENEAVSPPDAFNYDDPDQAATAHMDAVICSIQWGDVLPHIMMPDVDYTLAVHPDIALAHNAKGILLLMQGKGGEAEAAFAAALDLDPKLPGYLSNYRNARANNGNCMVHLEGLPEDPGEVSPTDLERCGLTFLELETGLTLLLEDLLHSGSPRMKEVRRRLEMVRAGRVQAVTTQPLQQNLSTPGVCSV